VAITGQPQAAGFPLVLELTHPRLPKKSRVKVSQTRTLSVQRLGRKLGRASAEEPAQVVEDLNETIGA